MLDKNKQLLINYIGIGVLLLLTIITFGGLLNIIIEKILYYSNLDFNLIFWIKEISAIGIFAFITYCFLNYIKTKELNNNRDFRKILITLIILFFAACFLQFVFPFIINDSLWTSIYTVQNKYMKYTQSSLTYILLPEILTFVKYAIALKIIIKK